MSLLPSNLLLPWLIVPYGEGYFRGRGTIHNKTAGFFSLSNRQLYKVKIQELANHRICGSCRGGWLVTVNSGGEIQVLHPFSKSVIKLPPVTQLPGVVGSYCTMIRNLVYKVKKKQLIYTISSKRMREIYIDKAVMSRTTGVVMVIHGFDRKLAFCRIGDKNKKWISVKGAIAGKFNDITLYNGDFYAVKDNGNVYVVSGLGVLLRPFVKLVIRETTNYSYYKKYLVEAKGELFLIMRVRGYPMEAENLDAELTVSFIIKKIDFNGPEWVHVDNFDEDCAVFVGCNDSFTRLTSDVPECKGNCIYFTDDCLGNNLEGFVDKPFGDVGVWDLTADVVERFYPSSDIKPPPVWFATN
ncbi:hypothetical protein IFM89_018192 [Coptis chinensis]|uniref:KIB1-4 beta-propeller domain-containing protein n=1 Tax=Coptis chinensis TaxID=261450 RepID=A0A835M0G0_9MAGN|nr:hypothetical protein IFM89_018192 [Coptis chinensis]